MTYKVIEFIYVYIFPIIFSFSMNWKGLVLLKISSMNEKILWRYDLEPPLQQYANPFSI